MTVVLGVLDGRRLSVEVENQSLVLRPEVEPMPAADSHRLAADVIGHCSSEVTRHHHLKAALSVYALQDD